MTQVGALYDALQRARDAEEEHAPWLQRKSSKWDDFSDLVETDGKKSSRRTMSRQASLASLASLSPTESPKPKRRTSGQGGRRAPQAPTPLSTIPAVYFDENFHLENPRTFDVVVERSEVVRSTDDSKEEKSGSNGHATAPRKALATNAILQEKLSWYMDTIEVHLISSISTASSSFFAALGSLRELHHEASESVNRIRGLRNELDALDGQMALGGLDIVNKRRRRENLKQLGDAIQQLKCVVEGVARCEALTDAGDIEMALDAIDALEELIQGEQSDNGLGLLGINKLAQARDLRGTTALQGVNNDMDILRSRIGKAYEGRFLDILLGDLRQHIAAVSTEDTLQRWSSTSQRNRSHNREPSKFPSYLSMSDSFRTELISQLRGLHRSEFTTPATTSYRNIVLKEIKTIIKRPLPSSNDEDTDSLVSVSTIGGRNLSSQDRSAILARNLRALEPAAAEEMLIAIYKGVGESLRRLGTQVKVLLDITSILGDSSATPNSPLSPTRTPNIAALAARIDSGDDSKSSVRQIQEDMHQALDMSNLLGQAVDIAQNQIVKVLRVRSEQSIQQSPTRFLRYFTLNLLFANECEAVSGRGGQALKTVVNGHIKDYVKHLSDSAQQKLASGMESDLWNAKDFNDADTLLLSQILESSDRDPEEWSAGSRPWLPYDEYTTSVSAANGTVDATAKDKARPAKIDSDSYVLPNSAILCLHGLQPFLELMTVIPSMSGDVSPTIVSYLQLFNSRCTQLILGAGATRSVGLKNITTKHLALASQALSFIAAIIPHVREFVRRRAGAGPSASAMMGEYDKVRRLYQEHQNSISDKLVDIMAGRASTHVKAMKHLKWADNGTGTVNAYMDTLVKETSTLHKVLSRHLPDMTIVMIMEPVFKSYKEQLGQAFEDVTLETDAGKQRYAALRPASSYANKNKNATRCRVLQHKTVEDQWFIRGWAILGAADPGQESAEARGVNNARCTSCRIDRDQKRRGTFTSCVSTNR